MAHKQDNIAHAQIRNAVERIERINEEIDALNKDKSEVYAEVKGVGLDPKILRIVISRRQMDGAVREEQDSLIELYEEALRGKGGKAGTKNATRARAREDGEEEA